jgi:hypothetical protein
MKKYILAFIMGLFCNGAFAFIPAAGLWYNPSESGRGFTIDYQNNTMAVVSYVYDNANAPLWYTSAGHYNSSTNTFESSFDKSSGGQCLGCPYTRPIVSGGAGGPIRIVFDTPNSGTIYFNGGSSRIVHFIYGYDLTNDPKQNLRGEWVLSYTLTSGSGYSNWIIFNSNYTATDGTQYLAGYIDGNANLPCLASYVASANSYLALCATSLSTLFDTFTFPLFDGKHLTGIYQVLSGNTLGSQRLAVGYQLLTPEQLKAIGVNSVGALPAPSVNLDALVEAHRHQIESASAAE